MKFEFTLDDVREKYPEATDELLEKLQDWATEHNLPKIPKEKLAIFAHSCYFNLELTIRCMNNFYKLRATSPEIFRNMDPNHEKTQHALDKQCYVNLPVLTPEGYRVLLHRLEDTQPATYNMDEAIKVFILTIEVDLYITGCTSGIILLFDAAGLKIGHLMRVSFSTLRKLFEYVQTAMPIRLKGIHVINAVWFMSKILAILRPLLTKETYDMIQFYTGDVSEVYPFIPPKCLPKDYGGALPSIFELRAELRETLHNWRDQILEEELLFRSYRDEPKESKESEKESTKLASIENSSHLNSDNISTKS